MSIAIFKKKTQAKYNCMSVSQPQFSLNGTLRNQGYIGQTSFSRTLVKTPMLGNTAKGHGGLYGDYKQGTIVVESSLFTTNDPLSVKPSVGHRAGDMAVQNRFLSCRTWPCSKPVVKNLLYSSDDYITELRKKTLKCEAEDNASAPLKPPCCPVLDDKDLPSPMFSKTKTGTVTKVITNANGSIKYNGSYSDYLARIDNACGRKTKLVSNMNRGPNF